MLRIEPALETEVFINQGGQVTVRQVDELRQELIVELSAENARRVALALLACADEIDGGVLAAPTEVVASPHLVAEPVKAALPPSGLSVDVAFAIEDIEPLLGSEPGEARTLMHEVLRRHRRRVGPVLEPIEAELERVTQGELSWTDFVSFAHGELARLREEFLLQDS